MSGTESSLSEAFGAQRAGFFGATRHDRIERLPPGRGAAVLELDCGTGATGAMALKSGRCAMWVGVETNAAAANEALYALSEVHVGDIESLDLPYPPKTFDVVFVGDRIMAFAKPKAVLAKLANLLKPGGWLFASAEADPLPVRLAPRKIGKVLRRAGLGAIRVRAFSGGQKPRLFQRRVYARLDIQARKV
jgi:SAM-dependent methyltransferase